MASAKKTFPIQLVVGVALLAGLCYVIADGMTERIVEVGQIAPSFALTTDRGRTVSRSDFGGKVLVLNFWATWCPPCIEEIPSLDALARQYGSQGVVVLAVSVDKNEKTYRDFLSRVKPSFETVRDPEAMVSAEYGTYKYPETYIIDRNGRVVAKHISNQDWMSDAILRDIKALL